MILCGLQSAQQLNGMRGRLIAFAEETQRWHVEVDGLGINALKQENLRDASGSKEQELNAAKQVLTPTEQDHIKAGVTQKDGQIGRRECLTLCPKLIKEHLFSFFPPCSHRVKSHWHGRLWQKPRLCSQRIGT